MQRNRSRKNRKQRSRRVRRKQPHQEGNLVVRDSPRFPNDIKQQPIHTRTIRYYVEGGGQSTLSPAQILTAMVAVTNGSASAIPLYLAIKLRRISMYYVSSSGFGSNTNLLTLGWTGYQNAPDVLITDRGTLTQPACVKAVPPPNSSASFWFDVNSTNVTEPILSFNAPIGSILDLEFEFILATAAIAPITLSANATYTGLAMVSLLWTTAMLQPEGYPIIHV